MNFDQFIQRTQRFEARLRKPSEFFAERSSLYLALARNIARSTMISLRPQDADPERWERRIEEVVTAVTIALMSSGDGLRISIAERKPGDLPAKGDRSGIQMITFEDVMQWIRDGLEGKPGGKIIKPEDETAFQNEANMRVRASIIMKAYYGQEPRPQWEALRRHIQSWMRGETSSEPDEFMKAIRTAWHASFVPIVRDDLANWLRRETRHF